MTPIGYKAYQRARVETTAPTKWIPMLFKEACLCTRVGIEAIERSDYPTAHERLLKVQRILEELMGALDFRIPLAENLFQLYEYIHGLVVEGNVKKQTGPLEPALRLLEELHETWSLAEQETRSSESTGSLEGGISIAR